MKKTATFLLICTMMATMAFAQTKKKVNKIPPPPPKTEKKTEPPQTVFGPSIVWQTTSWDFGNVTQNQPATKEFIFTNNGTVPIVIEAVEPSCNCTASDYTKEPILPGKTGYVKLTFNAAMPGQFSKSAAIKTNASDTKEVLTMKGTVIVVVAPK